MLKFLPHSKAHQKKAHVAQYLTLLVAHNESPALKAFLSNSISTLHIDSHFFFHRFLIDHHWVGVNRVESLIIGWLAVVRVDEDAY